jgi:hypothetical protein
MASRREALDLPAGALLVVGALLPVRLPAQGNRGADIVRILLNHRLDMGVCLLEDRRINPENGEELPALLHDERIRAGVFRLRVHELGRRRRDETRKNNRSGSVKHALPFYVIGRAFTRSTPSSATL